MSLEQTIRETVMSESMDLDARLQQLVRAGLMPSNTLPLLRKSIAKVQGGMSLQGPERDVMGMFINSMMYIVLGDDTIFNKARAGAKSYAAEEVELDENAKIVAHLKKRYGDNIRKSHVMSAAKDFGVDASKLSKAVRKHLGKSMLEAKEKQEYDYEGDMAMSQLKSIIANSQKMHDMLGEDTNLPEWVQSKITLAEDYISTAANYMQGEMNESKDDIPFDGPYRKTGERKDEYGNKVKNVAKHLAKKAMKANEEVEQLDELSPKTLGSYVKKAAGHAAGSAAATAAIASSSNPKVPEKVKRDLRNRMTGISKATDRLTKEEVEELDELSRATVGRYAMKAKSIADNEGGKDRTKGRELAGRKRWGGTMSGVKKARVMATEGRRAEANVDIQAVKQMNESYKTTFDAALEQYGIKSPSELDEEKRKEFFNFVDQNYKKGDN